MNILWNYKILQTKQRRENLILCRIKCDINKTRQAEQGVYATGEEAC